MRERVDVAHDHPAIREVILTGGDPLMLSARRLSAIVQTTGRMFQAMDFTFLFDDTRKLFSIGYRLADGSLDPNFYDLLASEARLASFVAISFSAGSNTPSAAITTSTLLKA
jgi:cyclic beta-1,2-glucan synthetase